MLTATAYSAPGHAALQVYFRAAPSRAGISTRRSPDSLKSFEKHFGFFIVLNDGYQALILIFPASIIDRNKLNW
jgi:hypothetical protein